MICKKMPNLKHPKGGDEAFCKLIGALAANQLIETDYSHPEEEVEAFLELICGSMGSNMGTEQR